MKKKMTMQDIGDMVGVTKSTVSRYFNGGYVKHETREKIRHIIEKNNYEPNTFAQSLKAKESHIIGVIAPCLDSTVSGRMLMASDDYLREKNYTSLFINTSHNEQLELKSLESLWRMNVDGIILLATEVTKQHEELVERLDIPVLFVAQRYEKGISIVYDDYHAGRNIGRYVGGLHFQKIVYIGVDEADQAVGMQRKQGVIDGLKEEGVKKINVRISNFSYQRSLEVINQCFDEDTPDIVICATDRQAMAAYCVIQERGFKIPEDVSVIGFGGYEVSSILTPQLTTIKFEAHTAGYLAGETIVKMIKEEPVSKTQVIDFEFIKGSSVKE